MDDQETRDRDTEEQQENGSGQEQDASGEHESEAQAKAQEVEEETQEAKEKVKELEENPPDKLEDWPDDKAKYETFGGPEGEHSYEEGPEAQLGPSSLRHHEDGKVSIAGDEVDDPEEYKGEPIPGGPTDPDAKQMYGEPDLSDESSSDEQGDSDGEDSEDDSEESEKSAG
jgi:hypothetical protein